MPRASSRSSSSAARSLPSMPSISSSASGFSPIAVAQQLQFQRQRDELLLGAVVQVALDFLARGVRGFDDPHPRGAQLLDARAQVGLQPLVVERQRGRGGGRLDELGARLEVRAVDDRRDALAFVVDRRPRPVRAGLGERDRVAALRRRTPRGPAASRRSTACGRRCRSASASRTGAPAASEVTSSARASARIARPDQSVTAIVSTAIGAASRHSTMPSTGPSVNGPT